MCAYFQELDLVTGNVADGLILSSGHSKVVRSKEDRTDKIQVLKLEKNKVRHSGSTLKNITLLFMPRTKTIYK